MLFLDFNLAIFLGFVLFFFSIYYYISVRLEKNEISRDTDILYSSLLLFTSGILIFQGWRLDPILLFGQFLISVLLVFTLIENIKLRNKVLNFQNQSSENGFEKSFFSNKNLNYTAPKVIKQQDKNIKSWVPIDWEEMRQERSKSKDIDFF